jgi:hypothetical protein
MKKRDEIRKKPSVRALGVACQREEDAYNRKFKRGTISAASPTVRAASTLAADPEDDSPRRAAKPPFRTSGQRTRRQEEGNNA